MSRPLRIEYPGACYHVMNRGNQRGVVFRRDSCYTNFLELMGRYTKEFAVTVYAYCLMPNHFHLYLQTQDANLSRFMQALLGEFTITSNRRFRRSGHLFQGRFKSPLIDPEDPDQAQVRRRYGAYLQGRALACHFGRLSREEKAEWKQIRCGWYLGSKSFRDSLLERIPEVLESKRTESFGGRIVKEHNARQARTLIQESLPIVGVDNLEELKGLRKSDPRKQAVVWLVRTRTAMRDRWVSEMLNAGSRTMTYRAVQRYQSARRGADKRLRRRLEDLKI